MPIADDEMNALRMLIKEELETALRSLREEVNKRFDKIATQMDDPTSVMREPAKHN